MQRKFLCRLLAVTLACGSLVACGTQETQTTQETVNETNLVILYEQDSAMINTYSMIAVDPNAKFISSTDSSELPAGSVEINTAGADAFINWMNSKGRDAITKYGYEDYGEYLFYLLDGAETYSGEVAKATEETKNIRISTTTSVNDSGLLGYLLPLFEEEYGYDVQVSSAGTGKAIAAATYGNADLILVHSKSQEETFISNGYARIVDGYTKERLSFMYNYFVLVGPAKDEAKAKSASDVKTAFKNISDGKYNFVSRGDKSGTHTAELKLWDTSLAITTEADSFKDYSWYISANAGMGACLTLAKEKQAYILSDKATYLSWNKANQ